MAKYSKGAGEKVEDVMHEMKEGKLKTGTGKKVTSRKQAIAIALSEARDEGEKIPKKTAAKKTAGKKTTAKKTTAKKTAPGKTPAKKTAAKKTVAKKTAAKKTSAKKSRTK